MLISPSSRELANYCVAVQCWNAPSRLSISETGNWFRGFPWKFQPISKRGLRKAVGLGTQEFSKAVRANMYDHPNQRIYPPCGMQQDWLPWQPFEWQWICMSQQTGKLLLFAPQYSIPEGKILKTKQVREQMCLLGGEGDRISLLGEPLNAAGTGTLFHWCLQWRLSFVGPAPALIPLLGVPGPDWLYGILYKDVAVGQLSIFGFCLLLTTNYYYHHITITIPAAAATTTIIMTCLNAQTGKAARKKHTEIAGCTTHNAYIR